MHNRKNSFPYVRIPNTFCKKKSAEHVSTSYVSRYDKIDIHVSLLSSIDILFHFNRTNFDETHFDKKTEHVDKS